jgi:hypothetical protein
MSLMNHYRTFRCLSGLENASTNRVLNLVAIGKKNEKNREFNDNPLFRSRVLNNTIIVKHRLRADETDQFTFDRAVGTKVIVPFERGNLKAGGKSFIIGQHGYEKMVREVALHSDRIEEDRDFQILRLLDQIPSLDPFLLREHLRSNGVSVHTGYFEISDCDQRKMFDYTLKEIHELTEMAFAGSKAKYDARTKIVSAILATKVDEKLEPLRAALQLNPDDFREGIFSWRGFIYYKWSLMDFWPELVKTLRQLNAVRSSRLLDTEQSLYLGEAKVAITERAKDLGREIRQTLDIYDRAYESLITAHDAKKFREFLLGAPRLFLQIGEKMGTLSHINSFWKYRFPDGASLVADSEELIAIMQDFSKGLHIKERLVA